MSLRFTSVVSLHTNPTTCGVAKFSQQLADRLGVPMVPLSPLPERWGAYPLLSLKWAELQPDDHTYTRHYCCPQSAGSSAEVMRTAQPKTYGVFWHDAGDAYVTQHAQHVFYGDPSLGSPGLFCPSLLPTKIRPVRLFTFGMAGKQPLEQYRKVKALLDASGQPYHLRVSVGLHEGTALDRVERHFDELTAIMGPEHVTILGIMTDAAVSDELAAADYVLAFFDQGARANNTTIHAAVAAGCGVITNWDSKTPLFFNQATKNIDHLTSWPARPGVQRSPYTWDALLRRMRDVCDNSR